MMKRKFCETLIENKNLVMMQEIFKSKDKQYELIYHYFTELINMIDLKFAKYELDNNDSIETFQENQKKYLEKVYKLINEKNLILSKIDQIDETKINFMIFDNEFIMDMTDFYQSFAIGSNLADYYNYSNKTKELNLVLDYKKLKFNKTYNCYFYIGGIKYNFTIKTNVTIFNSVTKSLKLDFEFRFETRMYLNSPINQFECCIQVETEDKTMDEWMKTDKSFSPSHSFSGIFFEENIKRIFIITFKNFFPNNMTLVFFNNK